MWFAIIFFSAVFEHHTTYNSGTPSDFIRNPTIHGWNFKTHFKKSIFFNERAFESPTNYQCLRRLSEDSELTFFFFILSLFTLFPSECSEVFWLQLIVIRNLSCFLSKLCLETKIGAFGQQHTAYLCIPTIYLTNMYWLIFWNIFIKTFIDLFVKILSIKHLLMYFSNHYLFIY